MFPNRISLKETLMYKALDELREAVIESLESGAAIVLGCIEIDYSVKIKKTRTSTDYGDIEWHELDSYRINSVTSDYAPLFAKYLDNTLNNKELY